MNFLARVFEQTAKFKATFRDISRKCIQSSLPQAFKEPSRWGAASRGEELIQAELGEVVRSENLLPATCALATVGAAGAEVIPRLIFKRRSGQETHKLLSNKFQVKTCPENYFLGGIYSVLALP